MKTVTTRIPASTANLGPGFDCLGVALSVWNRVTVSLADAPPEHPGIITGAASAFFSLSGKMPVPFSWRIEGDVPRSRGMGSSVTVRLGLLHGLNELTRAGLDRTQLFELCADLEGHPDNAAPAEFGGFTVSRTGAETVRCEVAPVLKFILAIPDFEVATPDARRVLPEMIPRAAAVMSASNACRITSAFLQQRYQLLRGCFRDGLHQPYREHLIPFLGSAIAAAEGAGALGCFLSGSGSTVCAVTLERDSEVAAAMLAVCPPGTRVIITTADNSGATPV